MLIKPFVHWLARRIGVITLVGLLLLVTAEVLMRSGLMLPIIQYKKDPTLPLLEPNQRAVMYLANCSYRTVPITINSDGHRGPATDPSKRTICFLGSSETFGSGVADTETYPAQIARHLREAGDSGFECLNLGGVGFGPYHQSVYLGRYLEEHPRAPHALVIRVSIGDRNFVASEIEDRPEVIDWLYERWQSAPFFMRKLQAQVQAVKKIRLPMLGAEPRSEFDVVFDLNTGKKMWEANAGYWQNMLNTARQHDTKICFFVFAPHGSSGSKLLYERLCGMAEQYAAADVLHLGPESFDLDMIEEEQRIETYAKRWSLRCDPHANSALHARLAQRLFDRLMEIRFFDGSPRPSG